MLRPYNYNRRPYNLRPPNRRPINLHVGYRDNSMDMIGHYYEFIQFAVRKMHRYIKPIYLRHSTAFIQSHLTIDNIPK
jgi:hypothetical protein